MFAVSARRCALVTCVFAYPLSQGAHAGQLVLNAPSSTWMSFEYPNATTDGDFNDLGNMGHDNLDLIGTQAYPGFYAHFDAATPTDHTDGTLSLRARFGGNKQNDGGYLLIGIDATRDAVPDLFLGSALKEADFNYYAFVAVAGPTPETITLGPLLTLPGWAHDRDNFSYAPVRTVDPDQPADLDGADLSTGHAAEPDRYLSFSVPFRDLVDKMAQAQPSIVMDDTTLLSFTVLTSVNGNGCDQDMLGDGYGFGDTPWDDANTPPTPVPEPAVIMGMLSTCSSLLLRKRAPQERRRKRWICEGARP